VSAPDPRPYLPLESLECDLCGGEAVFSDADGLFRETGTQPCITCGHPGHTTIWDMDDPPMASWEPDEWCVPTCNAAEHSSPVELEAKP